MLRSLIGSAFRASSYAATVSSSVALRFPFISSLQKARFSSLQTPKVPSLKCSHPVPVCTNLLQQPLNTHGLMLQISRDVTKFSLKKGKRKTVKAVIRRFKRLDWGCWIRTHAGRHRRLFKKSPALKRRLRQHIFTNSKQSMLLDKMVCSFWRRPKHWIDDIYAPYHKRDEFFATKGRSFKV